MGEPDDSSAIRFHWTVCAGLGVAVLACAAFVLTLFPAEGGDYAPGYGAPVYAFEMARSPDDLWRVFGAPNDPQHQAHIAAMDRGNRWDYLFMVLYGSFVASFFVAGQAERPSWRWRIGAALGVIAALADSIENLILLRLTTNLSAGTGLEALPYPVWTKFTALVGAAALAGLFLVEEARTLPRMLGIAAVCGTAVCLPAFVASISRKPNYTRKSI